MTIRRTAFAVVAAGALTLTACSSDDDADAQDTPTATADQDAGDGAEGAGFTELQLGDTFTYAGDDEHPAEVDITVDDISVSNSCHNGIASYMEDYQEDPESTFVQVSGEMDVKANTWSDSFLLSVTDWVAVDADGYTLEIAPPHGCDTDQINTWSNPLGVGQKRRIVEEFEVKGTPVEWGVKPVRSAEGWGWSLDAPTEGKDKGDGPAPTPAADTPEPAAAPENEITATCATDPAYQPGTTFYSNGTSGYTAACQQQMEDAMEASGNYPDYPFGNVDPNWTEQDAMRGQSLVEDLDDIAPDRHNGPGAFEPAA